MGKFRDAVDRAVVRASTGAYGDPAAGRKATQTASVIAKLASDSGHHNIAAAAGAAGALVVAAADVFGNPTDHEDVTYATFDTSDQPKRGWFR